MKGYVGILALFGQRHLSHYQKPYIDPRFNDLDNTATIVSVRRARNHYRYLLSSEA